MANIDVIGGIFLDVYIIQKDNFHNSNILILPGGSGLNVAVGLSLLGHNVRLFGNIGNDLAGEIILQKLNLYKVNTNFIQKNKTNTSSFITLNEKPIAVDRQTNDLSIEFPKRRSDYLFITTEVNPNIINSNIYQNYKKVFFDIGPRPSIITMKFDNVLYIGNYSESKKFIYDCDIVKLGEKGARWGRIIVKSNGIKALYQTGMGDVFDTVIINELLENSSKEKSLEKSVNMAQKESNILGALNKIIDITNTLKD